jgi:hypothetical protein
MFILFYLRRTSSIECSVGKDAEPFALHIVVLILRRLSPDSMSLVALCSSQM